MRFSAVFVVLSAAFATTSAVLVEKRQTGYADCALPCLATPSAHCNSSDTTCLCNDSDFVTAATLCFEKSCSGDDLTRSIAAAVEMCRAVGVTLSSSIPTSTSNPSSTSSSPAPSRTSSSSNSGSGVSNGVNALFALSAFGLVGYAL